MNASLVEKYIQNSLKVIQKKHNFDPNDGVGQIVNCPDKLVDYKIFSELIKLVKDCGLSVEIPYDPCGLSSSSMIKIEKPQEYVYFARLFSNHSIWKVGYSISPYKRGDQLKTGNHEKLHIVYVIPGDIHLESKIKRLTIHRQTDSKNEWRNLDNEEVKLIVSQLKKNCFDYLNEISNEKSTRKSSEEIQCQEDIDSSH